MGLWWWERWRRRLAGRRPHPGGQDDGLPENVETLEGRLQHRFRDRQLLRQALTHRSHLVTTGATRLESNERLEFLGDSVLGMIVNEFLFARYPDRAEGELTAMKARLVCGTCLAEVAGRLDLGRYVLMSRGEAATGGRQRESILADTTEALIGALYLDGGYEAARDFLHRWLLDDVDRLLRLPRLDNPKSRLQELVQGRFKEPPRYRVTEVEGPDHDRQYRVEVLHRDRVLGSGSGHSKKSAEQRAARAALERLEQDPELLDQE